MFTHERQHLVLDILSRDGRVAVIDLAKKLGVSDDTVRRDLHVLAEQGFLQKVHGGAVSLAVSQMSRLARSHVLPDIKSQIGAAVASRIEDGQTIVLDAGTTTLEVARALPPVKARIITNSLDIANCLSGRPNIELIVLGGQWDPKQRLFAGDATLNAISMYRADLAIIGACAVQPKVGITATCEADGAVKRLMMRVSTKKFLVADHSKFNQNECYLVAQLEDFDELFTDRAIKASGKRPIINIVTEKESNQG